MKNVLTNWIVIAVLFGLALFLVGSSLVSLFTDRAEVVPMGDASSGFAEWIALIGGVVSAAGGLFGILTNWLTYKRERLRLERDKFEFEKERSR